MECGAKKRNGGKCRAPAMANGRCRIHGGLQPKGVDSPNYKHGRYSRYLNQSLRDKLDIVADDNPLDIVPELQIQRALFAEFTSRLNDGYRLTALDIDYLMGWSSEIGRTVERIVKMRNETALTAAEIALIAMRVPEVVAKYIDDPDKQQRFISDLFAAVGVTATADQPQLSPVT
jgi:hypothetical protein